MSLKIAKQSIRVAYPILRRFAYLGIGMLAGGLSYLPLTFSLNEMYKIESESFIFMVFFCMLPMLFLSAVLGLLGGELGYRLRAGRTAFSMVGALYGGLAGACLVGIALNIYMWWG
jgi:hypothetical protein